MAWCASQFRLPAPFVLGPLLSTALLWSLDVNISFPTNVVSFLSNITIGSFIGLRFDRNCAKLLGNLAWPSIFQSFWMLSTSLVCAFLLYTLTDLPLSTALLGSTTGGVAEDVYGKINMDKGRCGRFLGLLTQPNLDSSGVPTDSLHLGTS